MKKIFFILLYFVSIVSSAQILDPLLGPRVYKKENVPSMKAVELSYLREADVMYSTRIWREIDMRQKVNHPLYFPIDSAFHGKRSLIQIIWDEFVVNPKNIGPKEVKFYEDDNLTKPIDKNVIRDRYLATTTQVSVVNTAGFQDSTFMTFGFNKSQMKPNIKKVKLMEDWFFDKQRSVMDVRILCIGFECYDVEPDEQVDANGLLDFKGWKPINFNASKTFWMFFPQIRPILATVETYNRENDAMRLSFDDLFLQRIFGSYIYKQENVYDRKISEYTAGLEALIEAEKIKQEIFDFEQNLWEY